MLIELANRNPDIQKLLDKGYALRVDGARLVVRDIPYLDAQLQPQQGAFIANLVFRDREHVQQDNHQVYFAGSDPYGLDGKPIPNLGTVPASIPLTKTDVIIERQFSNKPDGGFPDFFAKIEHYARVVSGPAMAKYGVSPLTFRVDNDVIGESVFKFHDTMSIRAEISDLSAVFKHDVIAIIGLGGSGGYLLDFIVKTPVKEIRGFDGDLYHVHNAFRSPGRLLEDELDEPKAGVYQERYDNFREGLSLHRKYIDRSSAADLNGVTFAFVCIDKGSARAEVFALLIELGIPFIDVGMGLDRKQGALSGMLRTTYYSADDGARIRDKNLAETADHPDDEYRRNVQIAELNALNAAIAVLRYKQLRGFYVDDSHAYHLVMRVENLKTLAEAA